MKTIINFLAALSVFLAMPVFGQTSNLKVNPNTGAIVGDAPTAANFKSTNNLASGSNGVITSGTVSISLKGLADTVWQLGPVPSDQVYSSVLNIPDQKSISWMNQNGSVGADIRFWSNHQSYLTSGSGELVFVSHRVGDHGSLRILSRDDRR